MIGRCMRSRWSASARISIADTLALIIGNAVLQITGQRMAVRRHPAGGRGRGHGAVAGADRPGRPLDAINKRMTV